MTEILYLAGLLSDPRMMAALGLQPCGPEATLPGRLRHDKGEGLAAGVAALWDRGATGAVTAVPVRRSAALDRYARVMDLKPVATPVGPVLGLTETRGESRSGQSDTDLAARIAAEIVKPELDEELARWRLPMIGCWAASQLRALTDPRAAGQPGPSEPDRVRIDARAMPYQNYFAVEELTFRHRLHRGGWSGPVARGVFVSGDAVVVLPWDMQRDRVLLVDQFRAGPAARGDRHPWLYEPIAGRIDAGETPESTARREAEEEAQVVLDRLFPVPGHYPSPGIVAEYIYGFVGTADLPDHSATVSGLASEGEDIRGHLIPRRELTEMAMAGRIMDGPLIILALWLDRMADSLRAGSP